MKKITKKGMIKNIANIWRGQYPIGCAHDKEAIYQRLKNKSPETEDDVKSIIGNGSWIENTCNECNNDSEVLIGIGEPDDYESSTAYICKECLLKAIELI